MGALRQGREYRSLEVYLAATVFTADFAQGIAIYLHEHAHIFGFDGSRGFTDALTELIESVVRNRNLLDDYDTRWESARASVLAERGLQPDEMQNILSNRLAALDRATLAGLLGRVPPVMLKSMLDKLPENSV